MASLAGAVGGEEAAGVDEAAGVTGAAGETGVVSPFWLVAGGSDVVVATGPGYRRPESARSGPGVTTGGGPRGSAPGAR